MSVRYFLRDLIVCAIVAGLVIADSAPTRAADPAASLAAIRKIGPAGAGHDSAVAAVKSLSELDAKSLPAVLNAMDGANPLAKNWLLGVAGTLADRGPLPTAELEKYFADPKHDADARYWVFQLLTQAAPDEQAARLDALLNDPGPELKYLAVEHHLKKLDAMREAEDSATQIKLLSMLLDASRHPAQIQKIAGLLKDLAQPVDLLRHFGFIAKWHVVGPFDNVGQKSFDVAYGPEKELASNAGKPLDLNATFAGKSGNVTWKEVTTDKDDGAVDLNAAYNNEKGAICYAFTTFSTVEAQPCEIRLGCTNANQVWLNGEKLISNEVYHTGNAIDQYTGTGELKAGINTILIKVCQNEQTEQWAQDFAFQLRVTDLTGKAIHSK